MIGVELWLLLGAAFDVGQAKRLFGLVGAGAVLGAVLGALVARIVAGALGARALVIAAAVSFALGFLPTLLLERKAHATAATLEDAARATKPNGLAREMSEVWADAYLRKVGAFLLAGTVTVAIADYLFKSTVAAQVSKDELGTTFASVALVMNGLALVVQVGLTSYLLRALGVKRALLVLPLLIVFASAGMFATAGLLAAFVLRATDGSLRHSLHKTTTELLFLPLAEEARRRAKPVIDLVAQRGGQAFAATFVLLLVELGGGGRLLAAATLGFALVWVLLATYIGAPYVDAFRKRLKKGSIDIDDRIPELDLGALEVLFAALNSERDAEVMGALDLLAKLGRARLIPALVLYHPSKAVVLRALPHFAATGRRDFMPIAKRLLDHPDPEVRAAALRASAKVAPDMAELASFERDARPELRATALVARLAAPGADAFAATSAVREMIVDADRVVVLSVVRALAAEPAAALLDELAAIAGSAADTELRGEAAVALGRLGETDPSCSDRVLAVLVTLLPNREVAVAARDAIASMGPQALAFLEHRLQTHDMRGPSAWAIARALSGFEPRLVAPVLHRLLETSPDGAVRFRALRQLRRAKSEAPDIALDVSLLTRAALSTTQGAIWLIEQKSLLAETQEREKLSPTAAGELLLSLFGDKLTLAKGRLFLLLGLLHPSEDFDRVARGLASNDRKTRATSRELCDNVLVGPIREPILLLLDDRDDVGKLDLALGRERDRSATHRALVSRLATESGEIGALARYRAGELALELGDGPTSLELSENAFATRLATAKPSQPGRRQAHD